MNFVPRLSIPEKGNPYYNTKSAGGYSDAIVGKPTVQGLNVLRNCVGYAYGRFNEIVNAGCMKYLAPVNAEQFIKCMNYKTKGLTSGMTPKLGAIAVWSQGSTSTGKDGAGHVAVVEVINADGSIVTSESGYNAKKDFWTQTRNNSNGRWGQNSTYKFEGFIYQPEDIPTPSPEPTPDPPAPTPEPTKKYSVGDVVYFKGGNVYSNANASSAAKQSIASLAKITDTYNGKHPYHARRVNEKLQFIGGGVYGWVDENDLTT